ncbi:MAG: hypothetical protein B5M55_03720 [Desulfococcus sp. 4484_242]|nr:MAG: hypothetical protein B5M55_03720 [Desulfococcus sp. 4484_242]
MRPEERTTLQPSLFSLMRKPCPAVSSNKRKQTAAMTRRHGKSMTRENVKLAIVFADVANSTRLYESLGNKAARVLIGQCLSVLSSVTESHHGRVIKTIGDEIMCTFADIDHAVDAAIEMNRGLIDLRVDDNLPPNIYVGIQFGPVIVEDDDVFGDAVNVAARMVSLAKQRQIITTEETVRSMHPRHRNMSRNIDRTAIKGKSGEINIYEIVWEEKDETIMLDASLDSLIAETSLQLRLGNQVFVVDQNHPALTLGRQSHNDLVIDDIRVSRTHARIEYRRGKFVLIDQSTNGTYCAIQGEKAVRIKRDEATLFGKGDISLGRKIQRHPSGKMPFIHFEVKLA